jgi:hypothetical protein
MEPIKNMKNILLFLLLVLMSSSIFAQIRDHKNIPFVGIWEYQKEDKIFRLIIWENPIPNEQDKRYYLDGHYEMVQINGIIETILYASNPDYIMNKKMPVAFRGTVDKGIYNGIFEEIYVNATSLLGKFKITLVPTCPTDCQPEIKWEMTQLYRIDPVTNQPTSSVPFIVPNGIILVKIQD